MIGCSTKHFLWKLMNLFHISECLSLELRGKYPFSMNREYFSPYMFFTSRVLTSKKKFVFCFIESPFEMMKNAFYFILKALFVLKIFQFLPRLCGHVTFLDQKWKVNFKIHNVTNWLTNNCKYTHCPISHEVKTTTQWNLVS